MLKRYKILCSNMKTINANNCCGCGACCQICPTNCIKMVENAEGFLYPIINEANCIICNQCIKVCPYNNTKDTQEPISCFAATNKNEIILKNSSSGGIFSIIAEYVVMNNGIVFGACFNDNWEVEHSFVDNLIDLDKFKGSKYVQSSINDSYKNAKEFLDQNKLVLFSGTPCQIHGLRNFLNKDYDNLILLEVICHGVPSPKIWRLYLKELLDDYYNKCIKIGSINFRKKNANPSNFSIQIKLDNDDILLNEYASKNDYLKSFFNDLISRPSCSDCPSKSLKSGADITIGDFWGIEREYISTLDSSKGVSMVLLNSNKSVNLFQHIELNKVEMSFSKMLYYNPPIIKSFNAHPKRELFFRNIELNGFSSAELRKHLKNNVPSLIKSKLFIILLTIRASLEKIIKRPIILRK